MRGPQAIRGKTIAPQEEAKLRVESDDERLPITSHGIAVAKAMFAASLQNSIDPDLPPLDHDLGLAAGIGPPLDLEELIQLDRLGFVGRCE